MFAALPSMKLLLHRLAVVGTPLSSRRASGVDLLTPLKAPFRSKATRVTTLSFSHAWSIALARTNSACSVVLPGGLRTVCLGAVHMSLHSTIGALPLRLRAVSLSVLRREIGR